MNRLDASQAAAAAAAAAAGGAAKLQLICPGCHSTEFSVDSTTSQSSLSCPRCQCSYQYQDGKFWDLVVEQHASQDAKQPQPRITQAKPFESSTNGYWFGRDLFKSPVVSWLYEHGWRQGFRALGWPGVPTEFDMAMKHLESAFGGVLIDACCASGLFTRRFAASNKFSSVMALDYSGAMLVQAQEYIHKDQALANSTPITAVRADIGNLPFPDNSIDAIHSGAAMHCWPDPAKGMSEIARVLKPGGVVVLTTMISPTDWFKATLGEKRGAAVDKALRHKINSRGGVTVLHESELKEMAKAAGLVDYSSTSHGWFGMLWARKAS